VTRGLFAAADVGRLISEFTDLGKKSEPRHPGCYKSSWLRCGLMALYFTVHLGGFAGKSLRNFTLLPTIIFDKV
jgi:hypothetical protein